MLTASTRLGPYEIVAPLGAGGMGEVYRARDTRLGREVAVKVLPEPFASSPDRLARFEREARAVAALSHPNILAIHDYGTQGAVTYAVMELLEGETLGGRLAKGPLPWREVIEVGAAIAEGLAAAHAKGIVHRDLKPENLFLTADGRVKVLDFGLARVDPLPDSHAETGPYVPPATSPGVVMGTTGYMAPEQVRGQPTDARSDLFSLGCVLYEMVAGRRAFQRETGAETMTAILHEEPPALADSARPIPPELDRVIRRCLAKNAAARSQSAQDLAFALRAVSSASSPAQAAPARAFPRWLLWLAAALVLAALLGTCVYLVLRDGQGRPTPEPSVAPVGPEKPLDSLAILPFVNDSNNAELDYLVDGLTEDLIHRLYQLPRLKVMSRDAVFRYKGKSVDAQSAGRALDVRAVLTGHVGLHDKTVEVSAELVNVADSRGLWAYSDKRPLIEVQAVRDAIVEQISAKLQFQLTGEEQACLTPRHTPDADVYLLYQEGIYHWRQVGKGEAQKALTCFQQATEKDPNYALAWAGIARSYGRMAGQGLMRPQEALPPAKKAIAKALQLDPQSDMAHHVAGVLFLFGDRNLSAAESAFQEAMRLNPRLAEAPHLYGLCQAARGRLPECLSYHERAKELDPYSVHVSGGLLHSTFWAGRYDETIAEGRRILALVPNYSTANDFTALAYSHQDKHAEAISTLEEARKLSRDDLTTLGHLGYVYARAGKRAEAEKVLAELEALPTRPYFSPRLPAMVYAALGKNDDAFRWLRKARDEMDTWLVFLKVDRTFENLHDDPRFAQLLHDMDLPP